MPQQGKRPPRAPITRISVGHYLRDARKAGGLRQEDVASALDVDPAQVSRWERGQLPSPKRVPALAATLAVDPVELLTMVAVASAEDAATYRRERDMLQDKLEELVGAVNDRLDLLADLVRQSMAERPR